MMCAINGKYRMKFSLEVFSSAVEPMTEDQFKEVVRGAIVLAEMELNKAGSVRAHITEVEDAPVAKRSRKASAIHFPSSAFGASLCGTKGKGTREWLSEDQSKVTCKRCLHQLSSKTLYPAATLPNVVLLVSNGPNRIAVIKEIRQHAGIGLKEAKELSDIPYYDGGPATIGSFEFEQASRLCSAINTAGGTATMSAK